MKANELVGVILTPRDLSVLADLYRFTVMSFPQIRTKHFANVAKPTALNRLARLEKGGLIERRRVPRFVLSVSDLQVSVVFQITKLGITELQKRQQDSVLRLEPVALSAFSVDHDLLLNEVIDKLTEHLAPRDCINGKLFEPMPNQLNVNPDAVLVMENGKSLWALELELTLKSEQRYRDLVLKYRMQSEFEKVIYVTGNRAIESKLVEVMAHKTLPNAPRPVTDRFYFVDLKELFTATKITITNGKDILCQEREVNYE